MDFAKLKANGDAALAQISNALDDLQYSPDQRPVPILHLAMDYVRDMLAILATASEQAPVAYMEPVTFNASSPADFAEALRKWPDDYDDWFPVYSSPAHTSEARDAERSEAYDKVDRFLRNTLMDAAYAEYSDALEIACGYQDAAMRQEADSRE